MRAAWKGTLSLKRVVYVAYKILLHQFVVDGSLKPAKLIFPGIHIGSHLAEAKGFIDMLGPGVLQIRVKNDFGIAVFKQPANQQTQDFSADTMILTISFADFDADFGHAHTYITIIALANQTAVGLRWNVSFYLSVRTA